MWGSFSWRGPHWGHYNLSNGCNISYKTNLKWNNNKKRIYHLFFQPVIVKHFLSIILIQLCHGFLKQHNKIYQHHHTCANRFMLPLYQGCAHTHTCTHACTHIHAPTHTSMHTKSQWCSSADCNHIPPHFLQTPSVPGLRLYILSITNTFCFNPNKTLNQKCYQKWHNEIIINSYFFCPGCCN